MAKTADKEAYNGREKWTPTPAEMERYLEREIELAVENLKRHGNSMLSSARSVELARLRMR